LRNRIRLALQEGFLTRLNSPKSRAGYGTGRPCRVCGEVIRRRDIEYEIDVESPIQVHAECLRVWREESWPSSH
jgi:hypothetical protein